MRIGRVPDGPVAEADPCAAPAGPGQCALEGTEPRPTRNCLAAAKQTPDPSRRETEIEEAEAALVKLDRDFSDANKPDYARKLYLIDKCLFGVDIQPIAVQIAKLRFFISLVVSQKIDREQDNANITALPNHETTLVAANSLIPIERQAQADLFRNTKIADKEASRLWEVQVAPIAHPPLLVAHSSRSAQVPASLWP